MAFAGVKKDSDRDNLIAFLQSLSSSRVDVPAQAFKAPGSAETAAVERQAPAQPAAAGAGDLKADAKRKRLAELRERGRKFTLKELKLPDGKGREEMEAYCGACHSLRLVVQQGQSRDGWEELFEYMVEEHEMEPMPEEDYGLVLDYLTAHYGIKRKSADRSQ